MRLEGRQRQASPSSEAAATHRFGGTTLGAAQNVEVHMFPRVMRIAARLEPVYPLPVDRRSQPANGSVRPQRRL
jgi:hypothetical protein